MIQEIKLDFAYVEQVFDSEKEYVHFLMLMHAEFQEAIGRICQSIREQNLYALRKTLHNVDAHLQMLCAEDVRHLLSQIKAKMAGPPLSQMDKQQMQEQVEGCFQKLLEHLTLRIRKENQS